MKGEIDLLVHSTMILYKDTAYIVVSVLWVALRFPKDNDKKLRRVYVSVWERDSYLEIRVYTLWHTSADIYICSPVNWVMNEAYMYVA